MAGSARDQLGECPVWDDRSGQLLRVDILRGKLHGLRPEDGSTTSVDIGGELSAVAPRSGGGMLFAVGREIIALDCEGRKETIAAVEPDEPGNRFNDCRCDPQGRLWAGTMSKTRQPRTAALYRLTDGQPIERVVAHTTLSNGIAWNRAGDRMYFVDSTTQRIDVFDFDGRDGSISNRQAFAHIDPGDGLPDGMTVDADGGIWLCLFGGGLIRRYTKTGAIDEQITLPVTNPTCPGFGGRDLSTLYITTARHRLSPGQLAAEPLAGAVLALQPGVAGLPANRFAG